MTAGDGVTPAAPAAGEDRDLKGWPWLTAGLLALVLGVLWTAQGLDLVKDSILSGVTPFAVAGPVLAVAGVALMVLGVRVRARSKRAVGPPPPTDGTDGQAGFPGPDNPAL